MAWRPRDPVSSGSHLLGVLLSIVGLVVLVVQSRGEPWRVVGASIYGASLILLYSASTLYHWLALSPRAIDRLQRFDHVTIFVLIAGTYTPLCLVTLRGGWGWSVFGVVWGLAVLGTALKLFVAQLARWPSTALYVCMGWTALVAIVPLARALPLDGMMWLLAGGGLYTVGALVYACRRPDPLPGLLGFHEVFHLLVLLGSIAHFVFVARYVVPAA
jgi:hemolysin III